MTNARRTALLAAGLGIALSACGSEINYADPTAWEALILGAGFPPSEVNGTLGAVSQGRNTRLSISISETQPGAVHAWELRTGACDESGDRVGAQAAYPPLTANGEGVATVNAVISRTLDEDGTYQVVVLESPTVDDVIACGDLEPASF
jgi:hypothetical protein